MKSILSIAGFDPSSGAGITQDIDVFRSFGFHGVCVQTAVVAQGPSGVTGVYPAGLPEFKEMLRAAGNIPLNGVKIGMVCDKSYVSQISSFLKQRSNVAVVVDPIVMAKNGMPLISKTGIKALKDSLLPLTTVVTPNTVEAGFLCNRRIRTVSEMRAAARHIIGFGPGEVIIKGGHLEGDPVDVFHDGRRFLEYRKERVERTVHGTGCMFSSLITSFRCLGYNAADAFVASEEKMETLIRESYQIVKNGYHYASNGVLNSITADRWNVIQSLVETRKKLLAINPVELIPEVQMNIGYALVNSAGVSDIAAFPGRIGRRNGRIHLEQGPLFGASTHVAEMILTYMQVHPSVRACVNVKYDKDFITRAEKAGLVSSFYDRNKEPERTRKTEGKSPDLIIERVLRKTRKQPDIIYDKGSSGKEPMIRIFGRNPEELIQKMEIIRS